MTKTAEQRLADAIAAHPLLWTRMLQAQRAAAANPADREAIAVRDTFVEALSIVGGFDHGTVVGRLALDLRP